MAQYSPRINISPLAPTKSSGEPKSECQNHLAYGAITKPLNDYVHISSSQFKLYKWNIRTFFP